MIRYRCCTSTESFESDAVVYRCPDCGDKGQSQQSCGCDCSHQAGGFQPGNLLVELDYEGLRQSLDPKAPLDPFALLPQEYPVRECHRQFPAGDTPVSKLEGLASEGVFSEVYAKQDYRNPSGSLKDRASLLVAAQAKYHGTTKVVLASTGNAGSAMSCAGAALGLEIILFVPASAPKEKLAQSLYYGAKVIPVDGTYDDAFALSIAYSQRFGGINRNTAYNPMTLEGKKTVALELYNQFEGRLPELIYVPVGDGVIYSGLCKGLEDLQRLGLIETLPRCIVVQAQGSNAIAQSFAQGKELPLASSQTLADSISVASPACGQIALDYLSKTQGWCVEVSEEEILLAQKELAVKTGNFVEPSSAVVWGGMKKDRAEGRITGKERALLLLTGSGFKDMSVVLDAVTIPLPVPVDLDAVIAFLEQD